MLFRSIIISAFVAIAAASDLAARGEEAALPKSTVTSTTRVYITLAPSATGTGMPHPGHNVTAPSATASPTQYMGAGSSNAIPVAVMGAAALFAVLI